MHLIYDIEVLQTDVLIRSWPCFKRDFTRRSCQKWSAKITVMDHFGNNLILLSTTTTIIATTTKRNQDFFMTDFGF